MSANGKYKAVFGKDSNFVVLDKDSNEVQWQSGRVLCKCMCVFTG